MIKEPVPTKRFVLEPSLMCNILCYFCYHKHRKDEWHKTVKPLETMKQEIDAGIERGNDYADWTGGEPTIYPHIIEGIGYALEKGVRSCIITNGLVTEERAAQIMDAGLDDWLVSRHGLETTHDLVTNHPGAYKKQIRFLDQVRQRMDFRFNCVISKLNQHEILKIAREMAESQPRIVNFINMNPHTEWRSRVEETKSVIADMDVVGPLLDEAIFYLEERSIGVNIRYFPMCRVAEEYRRCVCNDLQVMLDPYEWDYATSPKTVDRYYKWGVATSIANEEKGEPCCGCDLQWIC